LASGAAEEALQTGGIGILSVGAGLIAVSGPVNEIKVCTVFHCAFSTFGNSSTKTF